MSDFAPIAVGGETWFARSLATVAEDLRYCHPTVFFACVPRVWEKFQEAVLAKLGEEHGAKKIVIDRYLGLGQRMVSKYGSIDRAPVWERLPYGLLDGAVGAKVRHEMGLDRAHILITAAAAIHPDLIRWFHASGCPSSSCTARPRRVVRPRAIRPRPIGSAPSASRSQGCGCASPTTARSW